MFTPKGMLKVVLFTPAKEQVVYVNLAVIHVLIADKIELLTTTVG